MKTIEKIHPRDIRRKLGMSQEEFWSAIGVTQSGGSRYESGRSMPRPVRELLRLVHIEKLRLGDLSRDDQEVLEYLKRMEPDLYRSLKNAACRTIRKAA